MQQARKLIDITKNKILSTKTKTITITSGKGGVGKSTICANIGYILSLQNYKVCILDADIGLANMHVLLDIKPKLTLFDYINGTCLLQNIILDTNINNLKLIAGKSGYQWANTNNYFVFSKLILDILALDYFDFLLIDTGAGINDYVSEFLKQSPNILAVTSTDPSALTDIYALIKIIANYKNELLICFNLTKNYKIGEKITNSIKNLAKKNNLNEKFMVKYVGNIVQSDNITTTSRLRKIFTKEFINEQATKELRQIVRMILKNIK